MVRLWSAIAVVLTLALVLGPSAAAAPGTAKSTASAAAQAVSPPEIASYVISATYEPATHMLAANQTATYRNTTAAPIPDVVFHLYLNAFRSADTLWMREAGPGHRGYGYDAEHPGWITVESARLADGTLLTLEPLDVDETLVRAVLPVPVAPGDSVVVEMAFTAQLPRVFARTGWADDGDFVMVGQWFPKFGVWEHGEADSLGEANSSGGWNAYPFHANSEFYADFGMYDVTLTLPEPWRVGATGVAVTQPQPNGEGTATHHWRAESVIDFAWTASPHFRSMARVVDDVVVEVLHYPRNRPAARRVMAATRRTLGHYGAWYGPYGHGLYPRLTVVLVPPGAGGAGGMEYPTLFTVGALTGTGMSGCVHLLEVETVHELAHQWFQSMVATNEAEAPWLDEGFADYSTVRAMRALGLDPVRCGGWTYSYLGLRRSEYALAPQTPMAGKAWEFSGFEYGIATYSKPVVAFTTLERLVGEAAMLDFLGRYASTYAFAHPTAEDLRAVMTDTLGEEVSTWFFEALVDGEATMDAQIVDLGTEQAQVIREGALCVPVTVAVVRDGATSDVTWACEMSVQLGGPDLSEVVVDPERIAVVDLNWANNGVRLSPDDGAWLGATARVLRLLQMLFRGGAVW